eukprot:1406894-Heterocapsa_arctica.AAC.1
MFRIRCASHAHCVLCAPAISSNAVLMQGWRQYAKRRHPMHYIPNTTPIQSQQGSHSKQATYVVEIETECMHTHVNTTSNINYT